MRFRKSRFLCPGTPRPKIFRNFRESRVSLQALVWGHYKCRIYPRRQIFPRPIYQVANRLCSATPKRDVEEGEVKIGWYAYTIWLINKIYALLDTAWNGNVNKFFLPIKLLIHKRMFYPELYRNSNIGTFLLNKFLVHITSSFWPGLVYDTTRELLKLHYLEERFTSILTNAKLYSHHNKLKSLWHGKVAPQILSLYSAYFVVWRHNIKL